MGSTKQWLTVCRALQAFLKEIVCSLPQRYTPLVFTDLNSGLIQDMAYADQDIQAVGPHGAARQNENGKEVQVFLEEAELCALNTYYATGHTFFGCNGSSLIDYIFMPKSGMGLVDWVTIWRKSSKKLQAIPAIKDHLIVAAKLDIVPPTNPTLPRTLVLPT